MKKVFIIHENDEWIIPLRRALKEINQPFEEWHMGKMGTLDTTTKPENGVYYNRMSASSHTRNHRYAPELTAVTLEWLKTNNARVINGPRALQLEISKITQYESLKKYKIDVPTTLAATTRDQIIDNAKKMKLPFITKHNRGGKGLGVYLFNDIDMLETYVYSNDYVGSIDGITLIQEYIKSPEPYIVRMEFIGAKLIYAVSVNTSEGFQLCPCETKGLSAGTGFCPTSIGGNDKFKIISSFKHPLVIPVQNFLKDNDIQIAGVEFIEDESGNFYVYDINTNTNYNSYAEEKAQMFGMREIANFLRNEIS